MVSIHNKRIPSLFPGSGRPDTLHHFAILLLLLYYSSLCGVIPKSMSFTYEPASEPLHISVNFVLDSAIAPSPRRFTKSDLISKHLKSMNLVQGNLLHRTIIIINIGVSMQ
jgi:hypothetical protein